ncbi:unnamed protein product [Rhizophagus irregularis]|uniref:FAR-17a/AIG1-like protein n=1 Tax=Rhizophagus irregularis TaxID=588596 RepID=A0A2N1N2P4_9GLOM|nr:hypothetical protein RhiirC2_750734 [Rhizophagus irregularis]CAB4392107.1 unnamed protein product [Rhizophagus irregularis]CAB5300413.1 unnamed protein product [Rhizophagus irregularis]
MSKIYQLILHALGIASFTYSFAILPSLNRYENMIFQFTHLTIVGLLFSLVAFVFALLYDLFSTVKVISFLKTWFMVVTVPLEGLISILYWGLIIYDETLLLDKPRLPILIDLGFHLIPAVCLWTDFLFFTKEFRKSHSHIFYLLLFAFSYAVWIQFYFVNYGTWPYPILSKLETQQRIGFYFTCFALCTGIYHIGAFIHTIFNKPTLIKKDKAL